MAAETAPLAADRSGPVEPAEFAAAMARLAPFETRPELAVAVSGGPDSMALAWLARGWAAAAGGRVRAVVVDHRLRGEAAEEARRARGWLAAMGIEAALLRWTGPKPASGIQAAARAARYDLIADWCRRHGVLHLLVAHHADDQRETAAHRADRGSGPDGRAGMSAVVEHAGLRVLRPLLAVPKARLTATLRALGQDWVEDPTNLDPRFARGRLRLDGGGRTFDDDRLRALGAGRARAENAAARLLARCVRLDKAGFALLDPAPMREAPPETARRALGAAVRTVAGAPYPPRGARLDRAADAVLDDRMGGGRTLGGCRILPWGGRVLICREPGAAEAPRAVGREAVFWDGRYRVGGAPDGRFAVHTLGDARPPAGAWSRAVPGPARPALPALSDARGLATVPHLRWRRGDVAADAASVQFAPRWALADAGFAPPW